MGHVPTHRAQPDCHQVTWINPQFWTKPLTRLALASLVGVALGWPSALVAGPGSAGDVGASSGETAGHRCKCGTNCRGAACCCALRPVAKPPTVAQPGPPTRRVEPSAPLLGSSPCFRAAPCGDSGIPSTNPVGPIDRAALIGGDCRWFAVASDRPGRDSTRCEAPRSRAERIDDPPEIPSAT